MSIASNDRPGRKHADTTQQRRRRYSLRVRLALMFISIALVLIVAEIAARLFLPHVQPASISGGVGFPDQVAYDHPRGRRLVPNSHVIIRNHNISNTDVDFSVNAQGFRDDPIDTPRPPGEFRILALGDSITCGDYLPLEAGYTQRLEHYLNAASDRPADRTVRVINGGVGDIGLREMVAILEDVGVKLEPDVVLVAFYLNDSRPPWGFAQEDPAGNFISRHSVLGNYLYRGLKLPRFLRRRGVREFFIDESDGAPWRSDPAEFARMTEQTRFDWGAAWRQESWAVIEEGFDRIDELSREHGFAVWVVAFPVRYQLMTRFDASEPQQRVREMTQRRGWPFVDLLPVLRDADAAPLYFDQCHPNAEGNDLIGETLAERFGPLLAQQD